MKEIKAVAVAPRRRTLDGLCRSLEKRRDVVPVGRFEDCGEALASLRGLAPDAVIIIDGFPEGGACRLAASVKEESPERKVALFLVSRDRHAVLAAVSSGADLVAPLPCSFGEIPEALVSLFGERGPAPFDYAAAAEILINLGFDPASSAFAVLLRMITAAAASDASLPLCDLVAEAAEYNNIAVNTAKKAVAAVKTAYEARPEAFSRLGFKERPDALMLIYRIIRKVRCS